MPTDFVETISGGNASLMVTVIDGAACKGSDPSEFDPAPRDKAGISRAKAICAGCPVRQQCLDLAMATEGKIGGLYRSGIMGGATSFERASMARGARETPPVVVTYKKHRRPRCIQCGRRYDVEKRFRATVPPDAEDPQKAAALLHEQLQRKAEFWVYPPHKNCPGSKAREAA